MSTLHPDALRFRSRGENEGAVWSLSGGRERPKMNPSRRLLVHSSFSRSLPIRVIVRCSPSFLCWTRFVRMSCHTRQGREESPRIRASIVRVQLRVCAKRTTEALLALIVEQRAFFRDLRVSSDVTIRLPLRESHDYSAATKGGFAARRYRGHRPHNIRISTKIKAQDNRTYEKAK